MIPLQEFLPLHVGDNTRLVFDFTGILASGATIDSSVATIALLSGTGALPTLQSQVVSRQTVALAVLIGDSTSGGCLYTVAMTVTASTGDVLKKVGTLAVLP